MLKYLTYSSLLVTIISGAVCYFSTNEESFFYYLITSIVSGAIFCVLIAIKMITADTGKIDHKKHIGTFFDGGGGGS
tara:strand:+ start:639 stop:869 length:231 start_codon:yes stop_codon:yes gene_type:complete